MMEVLQVSLLLSVVLSLRYRCCLILQLLIQDLLALIIRALPRSRTQEIPQEIRYVILTHLLSNGEPAEG